MVRVLAKVVALPEQVASVKALLLTLVEQTRQEPGCIRYELWQNENDPTNFNWVEEWESREALESHLNTPHFKTTNANLSVLLATEPVIGLYQLVA